MIFFHISNREEIPLISILKLCLDTFVRFFEKGGNCYLPFEPEDNGFRFIDNNSKREKNGKSESLETVQ